MVAQSGTDKRLKVQIIKGDVKYNHDLNNSGNFEAFPLQMGSGQYTVRIMQNKEGNSYFELFSAVIDVTLDSEFSPFLCPSQYVNYNSNSAVVQKSMDLCYYASSDTEKLIGLLCVFPPVKRALEKFFAAHFANVLGMLLAGGYQTDSIESGDKIAKLNDFTIKQDGNLLVLTATAEDMRTVSLTLSTDF